MMRAMKRGGVMGRQSQGRVPTLNASDVFAGGRV